MTGARREAEVWYLAILSTLVLGPPPERCSISTLGHVAPQGAIVLAVATGERTATSLDTSDFRIRWRLKAPVPSYVAGHVFRVVAAAGDGGRLGEGTVFTVVPWGYGATCQREVWKDASWVSAGDTVVFMLRPTRSPPESAWSVFDVLGWHDPYPTGRFLRFEVRGRDAVRRWLSAAEYYDFLKVLPTQEQYDSGRADGLARLEAWARAHPGSAEAFPVREIIDRWRRSSGGRMINPRGPTQADGPPPGPDVGARRR